jgi:hypothetical protein
MALWSDTRGAMLPYVTIMLVVIVGMSVLALDGARLMSLQTQLQKGTDALALAAAAELDHKPDSITRANLAIQGFLTNNSTLFGTGSDAIIDYTRVTWRYLDSLPNDDQPIASGNVVCSTGCTAANAIAASFIEVTVQPPGVTLAAVLPATFFGGSATSTAGATAVAGNEGAVCKFVPMFICNPYETSGMTDAQATQALVDASRDRNILRRLIQLKNDGSYGPGNYGFLNTPELGNGANALRDAIARVNPAVCLRQSGVNTQPGSINSTEVAFNVRFDMYNGSMNGVQGNSEYRPAQNVRKGFACTENNPPSGWPEDRTQFPDAFPLDNAWPHMGGRMGDGNWDLNNYWTTVHPTATQPSEWATTPPSRYEVYRYEVANNLMTDVYTPPSGPARSGVPACYTGGTLSDNPDRRLLHVAIVNCGALALNGNQPDVPVAAFGKFFLTHPVKSGSDQVVYAEMVELVRPGGGGGGGGGVATDMVQLYR